MDSLRYPVCSNLDKPCDSETFRRRFESLCSFNNFHLVLHLLPLAPRQLEPRNYTEVITGYTNV
jgi:hypothetical protein